MKLHIVNLLCASTFYHQTKKSGRGTWERQNFARQKDTPRRPRRLCCACHFPRGHRGSNSDGCPNGVRLSPAHPYYPPIPIGIVRMCNGDVRGMYARCTGDVRCNIMLRVTVPQGVIIAAGTQALLEGIPFDAVMNMHARPWQYRA
jgi:hypothetical protein